MSLKFDIILCEVIFFEISGKLKNTQSSEKDILRTLACYRHNKRSLGINYYE